MGKGDNQLISSQCQLHVVDKLIRKTCMDQQVLWTWTLLGPKRR